MSLRIEQEAEEAREILEDEASIPWMLEYIAGLHPAVIQELESSIDTDALMCDYHTMAGFLTLDFIDDNGLTFLDWMVWHPDQRIIWHIMRAVHAEPRNKLPYYLGVESEILQGMIRIRLEQK